MVSQQQQQPNQRAPPQSGPSSSSLPSSQASHLLTSFTHFLTVCVHNILYYRGLYPAPTFLTSRAYNLPVHQSRHPRVCAWVRDAVDAVRAQLALGAAERVAVVVYDRRARVLERWMFDVAGFPAWRGFREAARGGRDEEQESREGTEREGEQQQEGGGGGGRSDGGPAAAAAAADPGSGSDDRVNWTDVDEQLRAAVRRLAYAGEKMAPLPDGCTFTVAVELRDEGEAPIGHPQPWIPTQPGLQTNSKDGRTPGRDVGGAKTTPLRAVEAGPLFFECWVEEGKAKEELVSSVSSG
ncbi:DNA-binding protein [Xylariaceae sp. FL0662B]|nr:DNA-binding protein [Xylariaceae sp. FL0662B]